MGNDKSLKFNSVAEMEAWSKNQQEKQIKAVAEASKEALNEKKGAAAPEADVFMGEKPISAMNKSELKTYADGLGLKYDPKASNETLRNLIREALE